MQEILIKGPYGLKRGFPETALRVQLLDKTRGSGVYLAVYSCRLDGDGEEMQTIGLEGTPQFANYVMAHQWLVKEITGLATG